LQFLKGLKSIVNTYERGNGVKKVGNHCLGLP